MQDQNCSACNEPLIHPKLLQCGHICCQRCIDKSLLFDDDGSASMKCPKDECVLRTTLSSSETSNDLQTFDISTDTVEDSSLVPQCRNIDGCLMPVTSYCCRLKMCTTCSAVIRQNALFHIDFKRGKSKKRIFIGPPSRNIGLLLFFCTDIVLDDI